MSAEQSLQLGETILASLAGAHGDQKASDPLELELQMIMSHHEDAGY